MKKIILSIFVTTLFLFAAFPSLAKGNYVPGFIITNLSDTIYGSIEFNSDAKNMKACHFKQAGDITKTIYYPDDIQAYYLTNEGKYYVSSEITVKEESKRVFFEMLVKGAMNLYTYTSWSTGGYYYIFENNNNEKTIISKNRTNESDGKKYIGVLNYIFRDCPPIQTNIKEAELRSKDLINLTVDYHNLTCEDGSPCILFENDYKKNFIDFDFQIYAGMQISKLTFGHEALDFLGSKNIQTPVLGVALDISSPRFWKPLSLTLDLSGTKIAVNQETIVEKVSYLDYRKANASYFAILPHIGLKYTHQSGRVRPVIETGGTFLISINQKGEITVDRTWSTGVKESAISYFKIFRGNTWGYYAAIGCNYQLKNNDAIALRLMWKKLKDDEWGRDNLGLIASQFEKPRLTILQFTLGYIF